MADGYTATMAQGAIGTDGADGVGSLDSDTTVRLRLYDFTVGSSATPADIALTWIVRRYASTAGTASAVGDEEPIDDAAPANLGDAREEFTAAPGAGSPLMTFPLNQRATYRWVAAPGSEFVLPVTATTGVYFNAQHGSSTPGAEASIFWNE